MKQYCLTLWYYLAFQFSCYDCALLLLFGLWYPFHNGAEAFHSTIRSLRTHRVSMVRIASLNNEEGEHGPSSKLLQILQPIQSCDVDQVSPTTLAYLGDVVFELFARSRYVWPSRRTTDLQNIVVRSVRAEAQSQILESMLESESLKLTDKEKSVLKRGRNAGGSSGSRKRGPKRLYSQNNNGDGNNAKIYQDSTALEALIGYTYICDISRCMTLLQFIQTEFDKMDNQ